MTENEKALTNGVAFMTGMIGDVCTVLNGMTFEEMMSPHSRAAIDTAYRILDRGFFAITLLKQTLEGDFS